MLEGRCPRCDTAYFGWALRFPRHQSCPRCGVGLRLYADGKPIAEGYSPFTAEEHQIAPPYRHGDCPTSQGPAERAEK